MHQIFRGWLVPSSCPSTPNRAPAAAPIMVDASVLSAGASGLRNLVAIAGPNGQILLQQRPAVRPAPCSRCCDHELQCWARAAISSPIDQSCLALHASTFDSLVPRRHLHGAAGFGGATWLLIFVCCTQSQQSQAA